MFLVSENTDRIVVRSPAKINLTLDIVGLLPNGYHLLRSIVHTVGLFDSITLKFGGSGLRFGCNRGDLETDSNLCVKAARAWSEAAGQPIDAVISLDKQIPVGAGLGGGSGNAAAILQVLNRRYGHPLSDAQLLPIATKLGADVPLFLSDPCNLMEGIGEILTPLPALEGWVVIAQPPQTLATPPVFREFDARNEASAQATERVLEAVHGRAGLEAIAPLLSNDLTVAAQSFVPTIRDLIEELNRAGALRALMTGSGSAVFGLFNDQVEAQAALEKLQAKHELRFAAVAPLLGHGP